MDIKAIWIDDANNEDIIVSDIGVDTANDFLSISCSILNWPNIYNTDCFSSAGPEADDNQLAKIKLALDSKYIISLI